MKVLITAPSLEETDNISGISSVVREIVARGDAEFIHFAAGRKDGVAAGVRWMLSQTVLLPEFLVRLKRTKPDVVHINTALTGLSILRDYALVRAAKGSGRKILLHIHGGRFLTEGFPRRIYERLTRRMLRSADRAIVLSYGERSFLQNLAGSGADIRVLENAVPLDRVEKRRAVGGQKTITFLGRLHAGKGLAEIIEACRELKQANYEFRFACYGKGPEEEKFIRDMSEILGDRFFFGGVITGAAKWRELAECDIFLLPSHYEGLPMSLLEAMAAGCIPVVSDVGSVGKVVADGINGFLTKPRDVSSIVERLKLLLAEEFDAGNIRENAQNTIRERFNMDQYIEKLNQIYGELS